MKLLFHVIVKVVHNDFLFDKYIPKAIFGKMSLILLWGGPLDAFLLNNTYICKVASVSGKPS